MRSSFPLILSSLVTALLCGCSGDTFAPTPGTAGSGGSTGVAGQGTGGSAGTAGAASGGRGGSGGASGGSAGAGGTEPAGAGGAAGSSDAGGGGVAGAAGSGDGGVGGASAGAAGTGAAGGTAGSAGEGGVAGVGGAGGASGSAGAGGVVVTPCPVLFVSEGGKDDVSGCESSNPLRSLSAALTKQGTSAGGVKEIRICAGAYAEGALDVKSPVNISGSWQCTNAAAWTLDGTLEATALTTKLRSSEPTGITFKGGAHKPETSGLRFVEVVVNTAKKTQATGVLLAGGASPKLAAVKVAFAKDAPLAQGITYGSAALVVEPGSNASVTRSVFEAGPGACLAADCVGSIGVGVAAPGPSFELDRNEIHGGMGTPANATQHGSVGVVLVLGEHGISLRGNALIEGGGATVGSTTNFTPLASVGLLVRRLPGASAPTVKLLVERSTIAGGTAGECVDRCPTRGIFLQLEPSGKKVDLTLDRVRVYGGDHKPASGAPPFSSDALRAENAVVVATSSVFHGGGTDQATPYPHAISLAGGTFEGRFVTVLPGRLVATEDPVASSDVTNAVGFFLDSPRPTVRLSDSLIVATDRQTFGVFGNGKALCDGGYDLKLERVRYVHTESAAGPLVFGQAGFFKGSENSCPNQLQLGFPPAAGASNITTTDVGHVYGIVGTDTAAVPLALPACVTSSACLSVLFPELSSVKSVRAAVLEPSSPALTPGCGIGAGINTLASPDGALDLLDKKREGAKARTLGALFSATCP